MLTLNGLNNDRLMGGNFVASFVGRTAGEPTVLAFLFEAASGSMYKKDGGWRRVGIFHHRDSESTEERFLGGYAVGDEEIIDAHRHPSTPVDTCRCQSPLFF